MSLLQLQKEKLYSFVEGCQASKASREEFWELKNLEYQCFMSASANQKRKNLDFSHIIFPEGEGEVPLCSLVSALLFEWIM